MKGGGWVGQSPGRPRSRACSPRRPPRIVSHDHLSSEEGGGDNDNDDGSGGLEVQQDMYIPFVAMVAAAAGILPSFLSPPLSLPCASEDDNTDGAALAFVSDASKGPESKFCINMTTMRSRCRTSSGGYEA